MRGLLCGLRCSKYPDKAGYSQETMLLIPIHKTVVITRFLAERQALVRNMKTFVAREFAGQRLYCITFARNTLGYFLVQFHLEFLKLQYLKLTTEDIMFLKLHFCIIDRKLQEKALLLEIHYQGTTNFILGLWIFFEKLLYRGWGFFFHIYFQFALNKKLLTKAYEWT